MPPLFPNTGFGAVLGKAAFPVGIVAGVIGLVLVALAYPVYNRELKKTAGKGRPGNPPADGCADEIAKHGQAGAEGCLGLFFV